MLRVVLKYFEDIVRASGRLSMQQWGIIAVLVVLVGMFCMRGFGSRDKY